MTVAELIAYLQKLTPELTVLTPLAGGGYVRMDNHDLISIMVQYCPDSDSYTIDPHACEEVLIIG